MELYVELYEFALSAAQSCGGKLPKSLLTDKATQLCGALRQKLDREWLAGGATCDRGRAPTVDGRYWQFWREHFQMAFRERDKKFSASKEEIQRRLGMFFRNMSRIDWFSQGDLVYDAAVETSCFYNMTSGEKGIAPKGAKTAQWKDAHGETRQRFTVLLTTSSAGKEFKPEVLFKGKQPRFWADWRYFDEHHPQYCVPKNIAWAVAPEGTYRAEAIARAD